MCTLQQQYLELQTLQLDDWYAGADLDFNTSGAYFFGQLIK